MLKSLLGQSEPPQLLDEIRDLAGLVNHLTTQRIADRFRDAVPTHLHRPEEVVGFAGMRSRIGQDCSDHSALVLRGDRGVATVPNGRLISPFSAMSRRTRI